MANIELIQLGDTYPVDYRKLKKNGEKSSIFSIINILENENPEVLNQRDKFLLLDSDFTFLENTKTVADFKVVIVNRPLQSNYFSRRISEKLIVVSISGIDVLNLHEGISLEMYITRFLLAFATIFESSKSLPIDASGLIQNNATGCLFDFCLFKPQVAMFFRRPTISPAAIAKLKTKTLPKSFVKNLKKEIKRLKIGVYYQLGDWLKENPIKAIILIFLIGLIFSELFGNYLYELIHDYLPFLKKTSS